MILSTYDQHINFDPPTIQKFLAFSLFGNMETNATSLEPYEEELLFNLMHRLYCSQVIDVKGIWPILNLCFENRSGLILMALFFESKVVMQETFHKKAFVKDLKSLENRNFSIENLLKILQILDIKQLFQKKYTQFEQDLLRTVQRQYINTVPLNEQKLYGQNEYDSEPSFHKFQNIQSIQQDLSHSNLSQIIFRPYQQYEIRSDQQDNTISIRASRKRKIGEGVERQRHMAMNIRYRAKRPNRRQKRKKMLEHKKRQNEKLKLFTNIRKQKKKLRKYALFQLDSQQSEQQQKNIIRQKKKNLKKNKKIDKQQRLDYLNSELELHSSENVYMENEKENEGWSEENKVNSDYVGHKKLRKSNRQKANVVEQPIDQDQDMSEQQSKEMQEYMIDERMEQQNNENVNQSIRNLAIKRIVFQPNTQNRQIFYEKQWNQYILASTNSEKKTLTFIKQMVETKDQISLQSILKSFFTAQHQTLKKYCHSYFEPILVSKLSKVITQIIANIIEILYTSINFNNMPAINERCACLAQLKEMQSVRPRIGIYLSKTLSMILGDFYQQVSISQTKSNIEIESTNKLFNSILRIKLSKQELKHTILIAMLILFNGFIAPFIELEGNQFYQTHLPSAMQQSVKTRPFLLGHLSQIFVKHYGLVIKNQQDQLKMLGIGKNVDLNNREAIESVTCFVTKATQYYINRKIWSNGHNINPVIILNRLSTTGLVGKYRQMCKQKQQNLEIKQILLSFYDEFLEFQQMQSFRVIDPILRCINQIKLNNEKENIKILSKIIGILQKLYWMCKRKPFHQQDSNEVKVSANIDSKIQEIFKLICYQFIRYADKSNYKSSQKYIEEYFKLIQYVFDKIIMISAQDHHYIFSLNLIVTHALPIIFKFPKENQQFINLSRRIVNKVQEVQVVIQEMKRQIDLQIQQRIVDEQDEANAFFEKQSRIKQWINNYNKRIASSISQLNLNCVDIKSCFEVVRNYKDNSLHEVFGVFIALACLDSQNFDNVKNELLYQFTAQSKEIKIEKYSRSFTTTNKFVVSFLNGYLKTLGLFFHLGIKNNLSQNIKASMLNALFLRLICQRQSKQILQLLKMPYKKQIFQRYQHIILKIPFEKVKPISSSAVRLDMLLLRHERIQYKGQYLQFCKSNIDVIINLYKQYHKQQNKQMIAFIAHNFITLLVFLMKNNASESIVSLYSRYLNNCAQNENILKGLSLKDFSDFDSSLLLIELFRTSEQKRRYNMSKLQLPKYYMEYLVQSQQNVFSSNQGYKFVKINLIVEGLNQSCTVLSQYPLKIDQITSNLTNILLIYMLSIVKQTTQYQMIATFLSFFKVHLKLRNVLLTALDDKFNVIFSKFTSDMTKFVDIQDFIINQVVDGGCDFQILHKVLEKCQKRRINGMAWKKLQKIDEILSKCIRTIQVHQKNQASLIEKYKNSLNNLRNQEKQLRKMQKFDQIVSSNIQQHL